MTNPKSTLHQLNENLNILKVREAKQAGNAPLELLNQIKDHETAISLTRQVITGELGEGAWLEALKPLLLAVTNGQVVEIKIDQSGQIVQGDQTNVAGDQHITHIHQVAPLPPAEAQTRADLGILLKNMETTWIKGVLEHSVHDAVWLDLGKERRAEAVDHPWGMVLEDPDQTHQALPPEAKIKDIFEEANRLLLILGEPGSGKTTTLLQLARDLLNEVKQDPTFSQPVPVIFNLSTWTDTRQPLDDWLVAELNSKYRVPRKLGKTLLEDRRILPLLDGLDEVKAENRATCVERINRLAVDYGLRGMVVCSRIKEYTALEVRLAFNSAIYLQPLSLEQVSDYFDRAGDQLAGLRATLQQDEPLQSLGRSPLMLNIMSLAYQDITPEELHNPGLDTEEARRLHLFDTYITRMFARNGRERLYDAEPTKQWLAWLARNMQRHNQEVFLIEGLQPSWLAGRGWWWLYVLVSRLFIGLLLGLSFWLFYGQIFGLDPRLAASWPRFGLDSGLLVGLSFGLSVGLIDLFRLTRGKDTMKPKTSSRKWGATITNVLVIWLVTGVIYSLGEGANERQDAIFVGMIAAIFSGVLFGLRGSELNSTNDIQTIEALSWSSRKALKFIPVSLTAGLSVGLLYGLITRHPEWQGFALSGIVLGLIAAIFGGINAQVVETKTSPNQGIRLSLRNAVFTGFGVGLSVGLSVGLLWTPWIVGVSYGLLGAVLAGMAYGGLDIIKHYTLRLILISQGYTPRNYIHFLDYAAKLIFLQKVGGGYRFIHRLLLEHFAAMDEGKDMPE